MKIYLIMKSKNQKNNIEKRLKLLKKLDSFKNIERHMLVKGRKARENNAEHSWHMAMWFLVFRDLFGKGIDEAKVLKMILLHDLPEIYSGDTLTFIKNSSHKQKEIKGAKKIFSEMPLKLSKESLKLWEEYEDRKTKEAKIVKSLDKLQPLLQSVITKGELWEVYGITLDMLENNKRKHMEHDKNIMEIYENLIKKSEKIFKKNKNNQ